jgi:hypothetical protein
MSHDVELSLWCHHQDVDSCGGILKKEKEKKTRVAAAFQNGKKHPKLM